MDYTILLNAQLDVSSIQAQLESLAGKYKIDIQANVDSSQLQSMQGQVAGVQSQISSNAKTTLLVDPNANNTAINDIKAQLQSVQAGVGDVASKTTVSETFTNGIRTATTETKVFNDEMGKSLTQITATKYGEDGLATSVKTTTRATDDQGKAAVTLGDTWLGTMGNVIARTIQWSIALGLVYGSLRSLQDGIQYVIDLNKAMTNTQMITGQTSQQVQALYTNYQQLAQQLGSTTMEVSQASDMWLRQGKSAKDAQTLTQQSIMLSKLAMVDSATAAQSLTAILNGFQMSADQASGAMDKMLALADSSKTSAAVSFETLSSAIQVSAASANQAGITYDQLNSYVATIATTTQESGDKIGNAMKSMVARMENIKAGATEDGVTINNVDKVLQRYAGTIGNVNLVTGNLGDAIQQLGQHWNELDPFAQKQIATSVAGIRQYNDFIALMDNFNKTLEYQTAQTQAAGLETERYNTYLQGVEASAERMKSAWQDAWAKTINSGAIKFFYDVSAGVANFTNAVGGLIPLLTLLIGALLTMKGSLIAGIFIPIMADLQAMIALMAEGATAAEVMGVAMDSALGPIGLAIAGISIVWMVWNATINKTDDTLKNLQTDIQKLTSELTQLQGTQNQISSLWKEFDTLRSKTSLSTDEQQKFTDIQNQIKQIMPDVAGEYDKYGNFILDASVNLGVLNTLQQKKIELDQQELNLKMSDEIKLEAQQYVDAAKKLQDLIDKKKENMTAGGIRNRGAGATVSDADIQAQKQIVDQSINQLEQTYEKSVNQATKTGIINQLNGMGDAGKYAAQQMLALDNATKPLPNDLKKIGDTATISATDSQKAFDEILKDAVSLIKQQKQEEIQTLQDKLSAYKDMIDSEKQADQDQYDARKKELDDEKTQLERQHQSETDNSNQQKQDIQDQLSAYNNLIDAQLKLLDAQKAQASYQNTRADKQKQESDLEAQIAAVSLDTSAEGIAKRKKLEDELAKLKEGMAQDTANNEYDLQKQALDQEKENAKEEADIRTRALEDEQKQADQSYQLKLQEIQDAQTQAKDDYDAKVKGLDDQYKAQEKSLQDQIKQIQDYLSQQGTIENDARNMMADKNSGLYQELIDWNKKYGDGLNETIVTAWQNATTALDAYRASLDAVVATSSGLMTPSGETQSSSEYAIYAHHSGIDSGFVNGTLGDGEQFAKLMKGEIVLNPDDMNHFMRNVLPQIPSAISSNSGISLDHVMELTINGSADAGTVQDINKIANQVTDKLIKAFGNRGMTKQANAFSI